MNTYILITLNKKEEIRHHSYHAKDVERAKIDFESDQVESSVDSGNRHSPEEIINILEIQGAHIVHEIL